MTKYVIEGEQVTQEYFESSLANAMSQECDNAKYAEYLNDNFYNGDIEIDGFHYRPSDIADLHDANWKKGRLNFINQELDVAWGELEYSGEIFVAGKSFEIKGENEE